ncbi:MAG: hypothetical protein AAFO75_09055, partial [Pseudomonadota bacterium]
LMLISCLLSERFRRLTKGGAAGQDHRGLSPGNPLAGLIRKATAAQGDQGDEATGGGMNGL